MSMLLIKVYTTHSETINIRSIYELEEYNILPLEPKLIAMRELEINESTQNCGIFFKFKLSDAFYVDSFFKFIPSLRFPIHTLSNLLLSYPSAEFYIYCYFYETKSKTVELTDNDYDVLL